LVRLQSRRSGVVAIEQIRTKAVSISLSIRAYRPHLTHCNKAQPRGLR
jgi:hypothetical protein